MGETYGDAIEHAVALHGAFRSCHAEIAALKQWADEHRADGRP